MLKTIFDGVLGFFGIDSMTLIIIAVLMASLAGSGWLLKNAYEDNARYKYEVEQWKAANDNSIKAIQDLQVRLLQREHDYNYVRGQLNGARKKLEDIKDETDCLDSDVPTDLRMLFISEDTDTSAATMPDK